MKAEIKEYLKPTKNKVVLAIGIPLIITFIIILIFIGFSLIEVGLSETAYGAFKVSLEFLTSWILLIDLFSIYLLQFLVFYPIACSLVIGYKIYKKHDIKDLNKKTFILLALLLPLLNPFFLGEVSIIKYLVSTDRGYNPTSAVQVVEVQPDSPFYNEYSIREGTLIYRILIVPKRDGTPRVERTYLIKNSTDFFAALNEAEVGDSINIDTSGGHRTAISKGENITDWGITVKDIELK